MKQDLSETCHMFFATLANPARLAIIELLRNSPRSVSEIAKALNQEQSMISHNLKSLERCKFVFSERRKRQHIYSLNKETIEPIIKIFNFHAKKYCPEMGRCLTARGIREQRKKEASKEFYVTHQ